MAIAPRQCLDDSELVAASLRGERSAFATLVERHQRAVCAVAFGATGNAALSEDLAQDTFVFAWTQLGNLRETSRVRSWLCGIARNLAHGARRRHRREELRDDVAEALATDVTPFDAASAAQQAKQVWQALAAIPAAYREVLVLYYQEGQSLREAATALAVSEDVVAQRLSRGRRLLANSVASQLVSVLERQPQVSGNRQPLTQRVLAVLPPIALPITPPIAPHGGATPTLGAPTAGNANTIPLESSMLKSSILKLVLVAGATAAAGAGALALTRDPLPTALMAQSASAPAPHVPPPFAAPVLSRESAPPALPSTATPERKPEQGAEQPCANCEGQPKEQALTDAQIASSGLHEGPSRGPANAAVTIAVFGDLECSFCAKVLGTLDQLFEEYPNRLRLVVKQFPLPNHPNAQVAAEATFAARAQGKFWEFHDLVLAHQDELSRDLLTRLAGQAGLDVGRFTRELDGGMYRSAVEKDRDAAIALGVRATPTFFINGQQFTGAHPIEGFRALIDRALAQEADAGAGADAVKRPAATR